MLRHLQLRNFRSIRDAVIRFDDLNVLIGANGSGKSNLVAFFRLLNALAQEKLQEFVAQSGGACSSYHKMCGNSYTEPMAAEMVFETPEGAYTYRISFSGVLESLVFSAETVQFNPLIADTEPPQRVNFGSGHQESMLSTQELANPISRRMYELLHGCTFYQFHDTSVTAAIRQGSAMEEGMSLSSNAGNLASYLYHVKNNFEQHYWRIVETIRQVFPHFDEFDLNPEERGSVKLNWREVGCEEPFDAFQLSDGTLRFIALATLLLQPEEQLPRIILIDEPELGLHPLAIQILASLIDSASQQVQLIVATQSVEMVDSFPVGSIVIVERPEHDTVFRRLDPAQYAEWLDTYSLGELWKKNVIGGRPSR